MEIGVSFSAPEMTTDPGAIRDFAQAMEGAGYSHILSPEHVAGGHPDRLQGETVHTYEQVYRDPFVLFSFMAGATTRIGFASSILILSQRQTFVVAKQAADLDLMCGGRLRLGVGTGRNWMEYEVLNEEFGNRGRRIVEQIELLRRLWTEELVTFEGKWHHVDRMGINPLPLQRPIPVWMGSYREVVEHVIKRIARIADGWMPQFPPDEAFRDLLERFRGYAREAGRDPATIGIECGVPARKGDDPETWATRALAFKQLGATHLRVMTGGGGLGPKEHIELATRAKETLDRALA